LQNSKGKENFNLLRLTFAMAGKQNGNTKRLNLGHTYDNCPWLKQLWRGELMALGVFFWSPVNAFVKQVVCHEVRNYNAATTANAVGRDSELFPLVSGFCKAHITGFLITNVDTTFTMDQILICQQFQLMHPILNSLVHFLSL
jgi:hypothetical protein